MPKWVGASSFSRQSHFVRLGRAGGYIACHIDNGLARATVRAFRRWTWQTMLVYEAAAIALAHELSVTRIAPAMDNNIIPTGDDSCAQGGEDFWAGSA